jgi:hypothetical protein
MYYASHIVVDLPCLLTRGTCELLIGNEDLESTNGEIIGHTCGGASVDAFVHLSPLFFLWTCVQFSHTCSKLSYSIVPTKNHVSTSFVKVIRHIMELKLIKSIS